MNQKQIAKILGLSEATVSLALRGNEKINHETREKVKQVALLAGYRPNFTAQALAVGRTKCIGMIITDMTHPFYADLTQNIYNILIDENYLLICFPAKDQEMISRAVESLLCRNVDAIIYAGLALPHEDVTKIQKHNTPLIKFDTINNMEKIDYVFVDMIRAGQILAEHLIEQGYSKFAFIGMPSLNDKRYTSFKEVILQHGLPVKDSWMRTGYGSFKEGYEMAMDVLSGGDMPDAFICHNDIKAVGVLRAVMKSGCKVPGQVAVASFDNIDFTEYVPVSLTTVDINRKKIAEALVNAAFKRINGDTSAPYQVRIEPELVIRESTAKTTANRKSLFRRN
jgi:LacI family transcriptional regulator